MFSPATGSYLERVQLTVEGTALQAFSDEDGNYRLPGAPAGRPGGSACFRTGLPPSLTTVVVTANAVVRHEISMGSYEQPAAGAAPGGPVVKLDSFVVTSRSMDGAAVAIHEQRFAVEMKTVVFVRRVARSPRPTRRR